MMITGQSHYVSAGPAFVLFSDFLLNSLPALEVEVAGFIGPLRQYTHR
jgi:hypothetical protein